MKLLDLTLDTPAANLALDEALFRQLEEQRSMEELLRLWEPARPFVVLGRSSRRADEVHLDYCADNNIPVLRRCSGGGTVLAGPGCLMYAVVLLRDRDPALQTISGAHRYVMERTMQAVTRAGFECRIEGVSDLALDGRKISGNALRMGRRALLYHGTLLHSMPGSLIAACLATPARQPAWRRGRDHEQFVTGAGADAAVLRECLSGVWQTTGSAISWPADETSSLEASRYCRAEWNERP